MHRAGRSGGCDATLSHSQGRADWGVGAPSPVTLKAGSMGRLWHHPLSRTEQGQSGGWGTAPCHSEQGPSGGCGVATLTLRAGPMGRLWLYPVTHRARPVGGGGWGTAPCHTQSRADQGVWALPPVTLIPVPGGLTAPLIPVPGGILPFYYIG
uniref:Uncharacterized protein n=1 Tax=Myotis myotis TaxID=51298 RepID=A0A7J7Z4F6_MYOMY|nr:hypothetical protein mMyoMyo1_010450 [Myotis myotis]